MTVESREETDWAWVTTRRLRVLAMLADDRTEQEIADELSLAYTTVRSHVEDLKRFHGPGKRQRDPEVLEGGGAEVCRVCGAFGRGRGKMVPKVGDGEEATSRAFP